MEAKIKPAKNPDKLSMLVSRSPILISFVCKPDLTHAAETLLTQYELNTHPSSMKLSKDLEWPRNITVVLSLNWPIIYYFDSEIV